jgi:hypothetical protein
MEFLFPAFAILFSEPFQQLNVATAPQTSKCRCVDIHEHCARKSGTSKTVTTFIHILISIKRHFLEFII